MGDLRNVCRVWLGRLTRAWWVSLLLVTFGAIAAEAAPFAYVANAQSSSVSVIDTASNVVVATVQVGMFPLGVAITPDGAFVYVTHSFGTVSVIEQGTP